MNQRWLALTVLLGVFSCRPKPGQEFRGHWIARHDGAAFQPCGTNETWWASMDSVLEAGATVETTIVFHEEGAGGKPSSAPTPPPLPPPLFVTLRGDTSTPGNYGPGGAFRRQLLVHALGDTTGHCP